VAPEEAHRFGTVIVNEQNSIMEFRGKTVETTSSHASMGIYIFKKEFLVNCLMEDAGRIDSSHDFGYSLLPSMVESGKVFAHLFNGFWEDIGSINSYYKAHMELLESQPRFKIDNGWPVLTASNSLPAYKTGRQGNIVNSIISPGCVVKGHVINSVLSPGVIVEKQAEVVNSVVMSNSSIGYHSIINRCILDQGVKVGKYCYIGLESERSSGETNITVLGQNVETPDYLAIGSRCKILPNTGVADFDSKFISADSVVAARAR